MNLSCLLFFSSIPRLYYFCLETKFLLSQIVLFLSKSLWFTLYILSLLHHFGISHDYLVNFLSYLILSYSSYLNSLSILSCYFCPCFQLPSPFPHHSKIYQSLQTLCYFQTGHFILLPTKFDPHGTNLIPQCQKSCPQ